MRRSLGDTQPRPSSRRCLCRPRRSAGTTRHLVSFGPCSDRQRRFDQPRRCASSGLRRPAFQDNRSCGPEVRRNCDPPVKERQVGRLTSVPRDACSVAAAVVCSPAVRNTKASRRLDRSLSPTPGTSSRNAGYDLVVWTSEDRQTSNSWGDCSDRRILTMESSHSITGTADAGVCRGGGFARGARPSG